MVTFARPLEDNTMDDFDTQIQCDESIPAPYNMTKEEYEEFCLEYNDYLDQQESGYKPETVNE